ncbi:uncharacterized protein LOC132725721 [Ruditapes philippinarum]|uniref:uncharacterized protein LOC132725721 n=1 Tax=Ruditapes philippinarum TaxID=129788 RepID=UPI00295C1054|nr:uncharacterized protein LOC132725721 [Ruditapes philippinarum]
MAKNVSTKFGDRRLVYLPPINLKANKTPKVDTIEAPRQVPDRYGNARVESVVPKEYAYQDLPGGRRNAWLGAPVRSTIEGNIVSEQPRLVRDQIFDQLYQQASTNTMVNYDQGQYPVIPPIEGSPHYMQYTNAAIQPVINQQQQQPPPPPQQTVPNQELAPHNVPPSGPPQEKHIYYGPNGEVLPGPPCRNPRVAVPLQDFAFEGVLYFGRLRQINLIESSLGFPKIPDYLVKELLEKYGQFERTTVRVVARQGRCFVHATPHIRNSPRFQPEYVPVYLDEDEEFDYDKFVAQYRHGGNAFRRRQPGRRDREEIFRRDTAYSPVFRPSTDNAYENGRWRKDDDRLSTAGRRTAPTRGEQWDYRSGNRRWLQTRDDIKPIERLDRRLAK